MNHTRNIRLARAVGAAAGGVALSLARLALAAPVPEQHLGLPRDVSVDGARIDWSIHFTLISITILFAIMCGWMLIASVRHDSKHQAEPITADRKAAVSTLAMALAVFGIVDGTLFYHAIRDLNESFWSFAPIEANPEAVRIEINAHQWAWDARYPGPDGKFNTADDVIKLNELVIPVNTPVMVELASVDVIHSLYLPNFRVKTDAVPGMVNAMTFQATETGDFDFGCAQHCGPNHYKMGGVLSVVSKEQYEEWTRLNSADGRRAYDPEDTTAHWGWEWRKL